MRTTILQGFQSTLPRRERPWLRQGSNRIYTYFNPHSHEGSDASACGSAIGSIISIHTPTKGATAILTNNFVIFCSISLIKFILYLKIIQILFIFRYKFIFLLHILSANLPLFLCLLYTRITIKSMVDQLVFLYLHQNVLL